MKQPPTKELKMASYLNFQANSDLPFFGGFLVFLSLRNFIGYFSELEKNPPLLLMVPAGLPVCLNRSPELPTVIPKGQAIQAFKARTHPLSALGFSVLRPFWPRIRGRYG